MFQSEIYEDGVTIVMNLLSAGILQSSKVTFVILRTDVEYIGRKKAFISEFVA